ncbi:MAG: energy transducer TonB [Proteobacteria bacterium]|nr:energy transducer TonB [Pseudomonadota bacterium]
MVRSTSLFQHATQRPDPVRIAAISAAILVNLSLFALLMQPISPTDSPIATNGDIHTRIITPPPPPPVPPTITVKPQPPTPAPPAIAPPRNHPATMQPPPAISPIAIPIGPPAIVASGVDTHADALPVASASETSLTPLVSPAPAYPREALRDGVSGTVVLELLVDVDGRVLQARVVHGSGDRRLDAAAREQILRYWRFQPAQRDGKAIQARGLVPVVFRIDDA